MWLGEKQVLCELSPGGLPGDALTFLWRRREQSHSEHPTQGWGSAGGLAVVMFRRHHSKWSKAWPHG